MIFDNWHSSVVDRFRLTLNTFISKNIILDLLISENRNSCESFWNFYSKQWWKFVYIPNSKSKLKYLPNCNITKMIFLNDVKTLEAFFKNIVSICHKKTEIGASNMLPCHVSSWWIKMVVIFLFSCVS